MMPVSGGSVMLASAGIWWVVVAQLASEAAAQSGFETNRVPVPSTGTATENGPGTLWVNPANLSYDPDARFGAFVTRSLPGTDLTSIGAVVGVGGLALGLHDVTRTTLDGPRSDWTVSYGTSLALPERISVGLGLHWAFVDGEDPNYLAYDAGLSWRPLPWFGVSGVTQNVGSPDPLGRARPRTGAGIALRPGDFAILGLDYARVFPTLDDTVADDVFGANLRVRPFEGLYVRGSGEGRLVGDELGFSVGLGIELYMDGVGVVSHGTSDLEEPSSVTVAVGTDEPGESLLRPRNRVPTLRLEETPPYQERTGLFSGDRTTWLEVLERLRRVETDREVTGMTVVLDGVGLSMARARELRDRIRSMEDRGMPVLVYLTNPSSTEFYVATAASRIVMHPAGELDLKGLAFELQHLRGLLDKVGVKPEFVKRAEYKSAPESFTETEPTPANLEATTALLEGLFDELVQGIATGRKVDPARVEAWIDGGPHSADQALADAMVDALGYPDEVGRLASEHQGTEVNPDDDLLANPVAHSAWEDPKQIAVIYVEGGIVSGESSGGGLFSSARTTGSASVVRALERVKEDANIRAVVLRVDSPGGSAFASDEIWRAAELVKESGKPVVVSMGGVAASGGYYVAAGADAIWAEPTTITGSIGVYSGKFSTQALQDKLGVNTVTVARGRNATAQSMTTPWDDVQRAHMQSLVDHTYAQFKARVAEGRGLSQDEVENVARGRVWLGEAAKEKGLVDELGSFQDAITDARERAGISDRRKVGLVEITGSGLLLESLAPALQASGPHPTVGLVRALVGERRLEERLRSELAPVTALVPWNGLATLPLLHPEVQVWALEPYVVEPE
jgi:protease-4